MDKKNSDAKIKANNKYDKKTYTRFSFRVRKEEAEQLRAAAAEAGESVNGFIMDAVRLKIEHLNK